MKKKLQLIRQSLDKAKPTLIVLVGESGAGKSTLCKFIDCPDLWYSSSGTIIKKLNERGISITHDNIHNFANKAYYQNPKWQIPNILERLFEKGVIILDGPRRIKEIQELKKEDINVVIFKILANKRQRFKRLQLRDNINKDEFRKILQDEKEETELGQLLLMSNVVIKNNGLLENIQTVAHDIGKFIKSIQIK